MAKISNKITINLDIKLSLWSAIKLRIAGKYAPELKKLIKNLRKI